MGQWGANSVLLLYFPLSFPAVLVFSGCVPLVFPSPLLFFHLPHHTELWCAWPIIKHPGLCPLLCVR